MINPSMRHAERQWWNIFAVRALGLSVYVGGPDPIQAEINSWHGSHTCFSDFLRIGANDILSLLLVMHKIVTGLGVTYWPVMHIVLELCWKAVIGAYSLICATLATNTSIVCGTHVKQNLSKCSLKWHPPLNNLKLKDVELSLENIA